MATQLFPMPVYIKGPLIIGTNLEEPNIKAMLHLEQPQGATKELARFVRTDSGGTGSVGLKIDLPKGVPNLQGLAATGALRNCWMAVRAQEGR